MLPFAIALRTGLPIHEQVVYAVTRAVVSAQLRAGDAFPSVRALSQELRINPNTAHRIVATLVERGILEVRPGIGTVVTGSIEAASPADRRRLRDDVERLVVEARRAGLSLQDLLAEVRGRWSATTRRAG
jgi:GntR family transcriptional regulator